MATDTVHEIENEIGMEELWEGGDSPFRSEYGKLMMWYFLLSDAFTFAGFLIAYGSLRFSMDAWPIPDHVFSTAPFGIEGAPLIFVTFMTFVLIVSSVTVLRAVQEGKLENVNGVVKWLVITIIGGGMFLGCQAWEWTNLIAVEGVTIYNNPFSSALDNGEYVSLAEAHQLNPELEKKTMMVDVHTDKGHTQEALPYLYDAANDQKYFEKFDHHYFHRHGGEAPHKAVGESFEIGDPYLIAYQNGEYFPGAYKTAGTLMAEDMGPTAFGTLFFFITGFHGFHVFSGLIILLVIALNSWSGFYRVRNNGHVMVEKVGLYWHFVDLVWVFVFLAFYLL
ncbi:cytochrome c oxidase subunit 3 [Aureispira anguillae]|uniref:Cytochrome c oxidase subunit 3 n=1 Tax=Aureispira anguillae TaxID=2864201 RepID=A0A915YKY7_9BACT|nr:cytochrome c oxidase subunit 3 [Aureispira anguillae]BDS15140.1 cytochrome c oxidase subunit 3 [Aureispira anguillae]